MDNNFDSVFTIMHNIYIDMHFGLLYLSQF